MAHEGLRLTGRPPEEIGPDARVLDPAGTTVAESPMPRVVLRDPELPRPAIRGAVPWLLSLIVHQLALIVLALWIVSRMIAGDGESVSLDAAFAVDSGDLVDDSAVTIESLQLETEPTEPASFEPADMVEPAPAIASNVPVERFTPADQATSPLLTHDVQGLMEEVVQGEVSATVDTGRLREAESVEGATGGVVGDMLGHLAEGDLLVVWLFDQSISLHDDRQRVAVKLAQLFEQARVQASQSGHVFLNAAAAFGADVVAMVPPTESTDEIVRAVSRVPTDESGLERVFSAVNWAARNYSKRWHERILIVVWTDESGDDTDGLEEAIERCRAKDISVSIVGPSAILGRRSGLHTWVHQPTGRIFHLEVARGPDSALQERLALPYWWPTLVPDSGSSSFIRPVARRGSLPPWYGGEQLEGLVSGMGPYSLSRLALQTGGTYTIFDRPLDRGPFRLERMRVYAADYRAADVILSDMRYRPLPRAVLQAVDVLAQSSPALQPPVEFFGPQYRLPAVFRNDLKDALKLSGTQAVLQLRGVQNSLAAFGPGGMEEEYAAEESLRYRVWYDLTRGRLLAVSVRYLEYIEACRLTLPSLAPATNRITFVPSGDLLSGSASRIAADEAERLLMRCVSEHADTPWAYLAQRELDYSFGIGLQQGVILPPPRVIQAAPVIGPAPVTLPAGPRVPIGGGGRPIVPPKL